MTDSKDELRKIEDQILKLSEDYFKITNKNEFVPYVSSIPVSGKVLDENDLKNLMKSSLDLWLTAGDFTESFEI